MRERLSAVDASLRDLARGDAAGPGFDPDRFLAPGVPRIRPILVLLSAQAARAGAVEAPPGTPGAVVRRDAGFEHVAVAAELLHLAVVLHDAALGRQGGRRRRAARRLIGGAVGLLGGQHLTLRALELAQNAPAPEIVGDLLEAMREVAEGHALTHALARRLPSSGECLAHAEGHTGAVFSFACRAGARLGAAERPVVSGLGRYGRHAGIAWHLAEDLAALDQEGEDLAIALEDRATSGRPVLPVSVAAERDPALGAAWLKLARDPNPSDALRLGEQVRASGAMAEGRRQLARETWSARQALAALPASPHREALDRLAAALVS